MTDLRTALAESAADRLPPPGGGATAARFGALFELGRRDLEVARLAEAHHDAQAIAHELGAALRPRELYGVWAASGPDPLVATRAGDGWLVSGTVPWCTGVGIVDRSLVTARLVDEAGEGHVLLLDLAVADATVVADAPRWTSPAFAATGTERLRFDCAVPSTDVVGGADSYLSRPGFWHGAIGVAACWAGGLQGLLDCYVHRWKRDEPHALAHLGSAAAWVAALGSVLDRAAREIDAHPHDGEAAEARARSVRHVIERTCVTAMDDLAVGAGPEPLAFDDEIACRAQQLQLYIRQCHGERDLAPLGRHVVDAAHHDSGANETNLSR